MRFWREPLERPQYLTEKLKSFLLQHGEQRKALGAGKHVEGILKLFWLCPTLGCVGSWLCPTQGPVSPKPRVPSAPCEHEPKKPGARLARTSASVLKRSRIKTIYRSASVYLARTELSLRIKPVYIKTICPGLACTRPAAAGRSGAARAEQIGGRLAGRRVRCGLESNQ